MSTGAVARPVQIDVSKVGASRHADGRIEPSFGAAPFVASLILTGIHAYLGVHVVERGVIFVDLSLAQIAALGSAKYVRQGQYRLYAEVTDTLDGSQTPLSPFRISVLVNGSEKTTVPFEVLREESGKLYLDSPSFTSDTLYNDPERTFLGEIALNRGRADVSVIARDAAGNERSVLFSLQIE